MPLALAIVNFLEGRDLRDKKAIRRLKALNGRFDYLEKIYAQFGNPFGVKRRLRSQRPLAPLRLHAGLLAGKERLACLDYGAAPKARGGPNINLVKEILPGALKDREFDFYGADVVFPKRMFEKGKFKWTEFGRNWNSLKNSGELKVNGVTYLDAGNDRPENNLILPGQKFKGRKFDFISICRVMHYLTGGVKPQHKRLLAWGIQWVDESGQAIHPRYLLAPAQQLALTNAIDSLTIGGVLFLDIPGERDENSDMFLVIQRIGNKKCVLHTQTIVFRPNYSTYEPAMKFVYQDRPFVMTQTQLREYAHDGIISLYPGRDERFYRRLFDWFFCADLLVAHDQRRNHSAWRRIRDVEMGIQDHKPLDELMEMYLQDVPDTEPLKGEILAGVRALTKGIAPVPAPQGMEKGSGKQNRSTRGKAYVDASALAPVSRVKMSVSELIDEAKKVAGKIAVVIKEAEMASLPLEYLMADVQREWDGSPLGGLPLRWNYNHLEYDATYRYYGISLAGMDFVFEVNVRSRNVHDVKEPRLSHYPVLAPATPTAEESKLDKELCAWPKEKILPHLPTMMKWGRKFAQATRFPDVVVPEFSRALRELLHEIPLNVPDDQLRAIMQIVGRRLPMLNDFEQVQFLRYYGYSIKAPLQDPDWQGQLDLLAFVQSEMLHSALSSAAKSLDHLYIHRGILREYLTGAKEVINAYPRDPAKRRQALVFYSMASFVGAGDRMEFSHLMLQLYGKIPSDAPLAIKEDFLTHFWMFVSDRTSVPILKKTVGLALRKETVDVAGLNRMLEGLIMIREGSQDWTKEEFFQDLLHGEDMDVVKSITEQKIQQMEQKRGPGWAFSMPFILSDFMDRVRQSSVQFAGASWRLQASLGGGAEADNAAEIVLYPSVAARRADPALELLNYDFESNMYDIEAPLGSMGKVGVAFVRFEGKTTAVILKRNPSLGNRMLVATDSPHLEEYNNWLHEVVRTLMEVLTVMPQVDQVMAISADEVKRLQGGQNLPEDVLSKFYGESDFLADLGFELVTLPVGTSLHFPGPVAFHVDKFRGPVWLHRLNPEASLAPLGAVTASSKLDAGKGEEEVETSL